MPRPLTRTECEEFLSGLHVGVFCMADGERGPLTTPVWYTYKQGGDIVFSTRKETRKARRLELGARVSFLVQVEGDIAAGKLPKYVSVEGAVVKLEAADLDRDLRPIVHRYLGQAIGDGYLAATRGASAKDELVVHIRPERWFSRDFAG
jgi:nitroimidazol reductase NimA-like FMN-containing flavoprotein (pyridoxamine 5'-phosphate oxidase superfamily)